MQYYRQSLVVARIISNIVPSICDWTLYQV